MSAPTDTANAAPAAKPKGGGSIMPVLAVIVLVPALCYATTQYVLLPKLKAAVGGEGAHAEAAADSGHGGKGHGEKKSEGKKEAGGHGAKKDEKGKSGGSGNYAHSHEFGDVIVNLAGVKGTRYLRTKFTLASSDTNLETLIKANENQLRDIAIGVLSTQTLDSLEAPGARNAVRNELIAQFNHALRGELVEQIYFTEFVVQ
jgi:flagellar basal body-associated protein FliL